MTASDPTPPSASAPQRPGWLNRIASLLRVIGQQRFALGMVVALVVLMTVPQIREFLLIYRIVSWPGLSEALFVALSALATWYAGRVAYRIDPNPRERGNQAELEAHPRLRRWLPRLYALVVPLAPASAAWQLALPEKAALYAAMAVVLFGAVCVRRPLLRRLMPQQMANLSDAARDPVADGWRGLRRSEKRVLAAASFTALVLVVLSWARPDWLAAAIGTTGVLFLSGAVVAVLGTVAMQEAARAELPFTLILILWLGVVALIPIGKLHYIRSADPSTPTPQEQRHTPTPDPFRIASPVLVAAEGGGIRAAYWAALATHTLDLLSDGEFRRRTTLASGVSGGSLGLATFALTRDAPPLQDDCRVPPLDLADSPQMRALNLGHCFLAEDYLGAVALRMLWHDMPRLLAPIPFWTDRGVALENGWSREWHRLSGRADFDAPLSALDTTHTLWVFNSTHVESGNRVIQSMPWIPRLARLAPAALDGRSVVGLGIQLKQAVHNSARFTYVSPSGAVRRDGSVQQLVDGGYFENSGLSIVNDFLIFDREAPEIEEAMLMAADPFSVDAAAQRSIEPQRMDGLSDAAERAAPMVLLLTNDTAIAPVPAGCPAPPPTPDPRGVNEIVAPLATLLDVRSARGSYAREQTRGLIGEEDFFQLAIHPRQGGVNVPLGWALSEESIAEMQRQMWCAPARCEFSNPDTLGALVARLGGDSARAQQTLAMLCAEIPAPAP